MKALRCQRLPEMERLGHFFTHINGIAASCNLVVRFVSWESLSATIKGKGLRHVRGMCDEPFLVVKLKWATPGRFRPRLHGLHSRRTAALKSVQNGIFGTAQSGSNLAGTTLRHEGACRLLADGVDIRIVRLILGHASIDGDQTRVERAHEQRVAEHRETAVVGAAADARRRRGV